MVDLIFSAPIAPGSSPVELVFGDDGGPSHDVVGRVSIRLPGPRVALRIVRRKTAVVRAVLPGARVALQAEYHSRTDRPTVGISPTRFQAAARVARPQAGLYQQGLPVQHSNLARAEHARSIGVGLQAAWEQASAVRAEIVSLAEAARHIGAAQLQDWQEAARRRWASLQAWQEAGRVGRSVAQGFEQAWRRRAAAASDFTQGGVAGASVHTDFRHGLALRVVLQSRYEEARRPGPGVTAPVLPPVEPPCYVPAVGGPVDLVFSRRWTASTHLVFVCCKAGPGPQPPIYQIPLLRVYMTVHSMEAALLPSMEPVALTDVTIASDDDGFGWGLSASGPGHLLEQLAPVGGLPARIRVVVDGIDFVFAVMSLPRTRRFGESRVSVQGVSTSALLGSPYMPEQTWLGATPATAQQLLLQALEFTGVAVDWRIADWLVPAGVWSHRGTPLSAVMRVAESVGAVVRSHRTEERLIVAPRYPSLPWQWGAAVPDISMPAAVIATDDLRPEPRAPYNAVYISGQDGGVLGHVVRAGTAGDMLAPQITDALITDVAAARQRGEAVLAAAGNKVTQSITMPLITGGTAPGLIQPGQLIEVADIGHTWRGLVRATRLSASLPVVRQQITVERVAA